jgi:nitroreductase
LSYHEKIGYKLDLELNGFNELKGLLSHQRTSFLAGTKQMTKEGCLENARMDFACLALNRVSVRDFSVVKVSTDQIKKAVRIAQKSPSVCNRQSTRIYFMNDASKLVQGSFLSGIRGMEGLIKQALIVTSDLSSFVTAGERNQCYVDGGIFLMSLLYSLQYLGLGACTLNWSVEKCDDKRLRKQFPVNSSENIIAFIAVGHLKDRFQVPVSSRLPTEDILRIL